MYNSSNNINTLGEFCMIRLSANFSDEKKKYYQNMQVIILNYYPILKVEMKSC